MESEVLSMCDDEVLVEVAYRFDVGNTVGRFVSEWLHIITRSRLIVV